MTAPGRHNPAIATGLTERVRFDFIRYANCWEDPNLLFEALQPAGKRILSIASGGDNSLALLGEAAGEVVAVDLSDAQLACTELKVAAFRELDDDALLSFLGIQPADDRHAIYRNRLRQHLTEATAGFWDARAQTLINGLIHAGKFESYFRIFRTLILPLIHRPRTVTALLRDRTPEQRIAFYRQHWNNRRWRLMMRLFFSRHVMARLGRDPEFFRFVEGSVADQVLRRTEHALTTLSTHDNPYLTYILTGQFGPALPAYLEPDRRDRIRNNLDRLHLCKATVEQAPGTFDGFNLSDIFEYQSESSAHAIYSQLLDKARPGARLAYWNMRVPRRAPTSLRHRIIDHVSLADRLHATDRAFFYQRFIIEEVRA